MRLLPGLTRCESYMVLKSNIPSPNIIPDWVKYVRRLLDVPAERAAEIFFSIEDDVLLMLDDILLSIVILFYYMLRNKSRCPVNLHHLLTTF